MTLTAGLRPSAKKHLQVLCRALASRQPGRQLLNLAYNFLSSPAKALFHRLFADLFQDQDGRLAEGEWRVRFMGNAVRLPLRPGHARLDWTAAISILGHETDIKSTYAHLLADRGRPIEVFLDVGANYGTHTLLFAASGVKTIAFEPNSECQSYCTAAAALNDLKIRWVPVALGDHEGEVNLVYPKGLTWLGSVMPDVAERLGNDHASAFTSRVKLDILDRYASDLPTGVRILLKIDVEGGELSVLRGARSLLERTPAPLIIFESNDSSSRGDLADLLGTYGYSLFGLPFASAAHGRSLSRADFVASPNTNFIARKDGVRAA